MASSSRKKTYAFSKTPLCMWRKRDQVLPDPTNLFLIRFEQGKIQHCTFQTYCFHGNAIRRILVEGEDCLDVFLQKTPSEIIHTMQEALQSDCSSYYYKLMDFISIYLNLTMHEKLKDILPEYKKHCFENKLKRLAQNEKNEKNQKEYDSWISFHRLQEICEDMLAKVQACDDITPLNYVGTSKSQLYLQQRNFKMRRIQFQEAIMVSLYILIPPCRNDLMDIKYCLYDKEKDNYFFKNEEGAGVIVLNHYKTMKAYGKCQMDLPSRITNLISDFIEKFQPAAPFLFYNRQGNVYKESTFSSHITDIFIKQTDKHINIQTLRKIYATQSSFESIEKTKNVARRMGHSIKTHYTYKKNNDDDDSIRRFSFQDATRQLYNPKFDGNDFYLFRAGLLQKNPYLEVETLKNTLSLIGFPEKFYIDDYNENNAIQKEFVLQLQKDHPGVNV
jgi:hypothetical protein